MSYSYTLTNNALAADAQPVIRSDGAVIPNDPHNADWQACLAWLAAGNTPNPAPAAPAPAPSCTALQFRLAINQMGLRSQVDTYVAQAGQDVKDWWEYSTEIHADHPLLLQAATALGKTQADIAAVIALGKTIG